ncbi:signal peptidase II [bacterium]|nr:signal peptidase II [bacterium]
MKKWTPGLILLAIIIALDQVTKIWIQNNVRPHEGVQVLGNFFRITYVLNPGGAFSTRFGGNIFYIIVAILASAFVVVYLNKSIDGNKWLKTALFVILAGAMGNLIDRFRVGQVVDWLDFGWDATRWPTFNIADSAIVLGLIILIFTGSQEDSAASKEESKGIQDDGKASDNRGSRGNTSDEARYLSGSDLVEPEPEPNTEANKG